MIVSQWALWVFHIVRCEYRSMFVVRCSQWTSKASKCFYSGKWCPASCLFLCGQKKARALLAQDFEKRLFLEQWSNESMVSSHSFCLLLSVSSCELCAYAWSESLCKSHRVLLEKICGQYNRKRAKKTSAQKKSRVPLCLRFSGFCAGGIIGFPKAALRFLEESLLSRRFPPVSFCFVWAVSWRVRLFLLLALLLQSLA